MKILQIMPEFGLAGAERMAQALSVELKKAGHCVAAVSLYDFPSPITEELEANGIRVYSLGKRRGLDLRMIPRLIRIFRQLQPDVIHTHRYVDEYVIPAAVAAGIRNRVHTVHNMARKERLVRGLQWCFFHWFRLQPVAISEEVGRSVQDLYGLKPEQVPVVYNGIYRELCGRKQSYAPGKPFRFLHVGRFTPAKNHRALLEAFAMVHKAHPDTTLTLVGKGELEESVVRLAEELGLGTAVEMPGLVPEIARICHTYDAFVLPSLYEGMPMSLIEAMASGMPILASNVGGVPDMLRQEEDALLCTPEPASIAEGMLRLYADQSLRQRLGQQAQIRSDAFSAGKMAEGYVNIYKSLNI